MKNLKLTGKILIVLLVIQAIFELLIGMNVLFSFQNALENIFEITYSSELDILGIIIGGYLLLLTTLLFLSIIWILKGKQAGTTIAIIVGAIFVLFGILSYCKLGQIDGLIGDSIRGLLTIFLAYVTGKELKKDKTIQ
ncbi:MAG: hypothetical protein QMC34_02295 [Flavobacteriales bacterium]|jgi:hypothetical protein|tara:strand:- start:159 stop:572 length:414 start_codon:yes stop_codon:yes gene_type:complete